MNLPPGSIFVHRNLGGLVNHKDLNVMSCLEYALVLGVKHVIVCGHYNCGACCFTCALRCITVRHAHLPLPHSPAQPWSPAMAYSYRRWPLSVCWLYAPCA